MRAVNVAAVQFATKTAVGAPDAQEIVLGETRDCLEELSGYGLDLVVLSEAVGATGQTIEQAEATEHPGPFLSLYSEWAAANRCHVAGSTKLREKDSTYNAVVFVDRGGQVIGHYEKTFLTQSELEEGLTPGKGPVVVKTDIGRLGGIICFDLNFEWLRQGYRALRPDILAFASMYHGGLMQSMWAYDCRAFFVSALPQTGGGILDPFGRSLALTDCYSTVARSTINLDRVMVHLDRNREKFPDIETKYLGKIVIDIPPNIGSALICSVTNELAARDVVEEFDLLLLDDFLDQSIAANRDKRQSS